MIKKNEVFLCQVLLFFGMMCSLAFAEAKTSSIEKTSKENFHVYVLIGGVNMAGRAVISKDNEETIDRGYLLNENGEWEPARAPLNRYSNIRAEQDRQGLGPGQSFLMNMLEKTDKDVSIGLVVNAGVGNNNFIEHWRYKDENYRRTRARIKQAIKKGSLKGILWHQDNNRIDSSLSYVKDLISNLRVDFGDLNLPFVVGEVAGSSSSTYDSKYRALVEDVHALSYAKAEGLVLKGKFFDAQSVKALGESYAKNMLKLQEEWGKRDLSSVGPKRPFFDVHIHAQSNKENGLDALSDWMDRNEVDQVINMPLTQTRPKNEKERMMMLSNYRKYKGKIHRFCVFNPDEVSSVDEAVAILEKEKLDGAIGFGEHYGRERMFDDPSNLRIYAACEKVGFPVIFHIDNNKNMDEKGLPRLERVLKMFPKAKIIAHAQFWLQLNNGTCDRLLQEYPNLYADPSGLRMAMVLNRDRKYTRQFLIRNADKVLFGSDAGWWSFSKARKDREIQFALFEHFDLPEEVKRKIYFDNAIKLFGLENKSNQP
jgi:uncharacterized protein